MILTTVFKTPGVDIFNILWHSVKFLERYEWKLSTLYIVVTFYIVYQCGRFCISSWIIILFFDDEDKLIDVN